MLLLRVAEILGIEQSALEDAFDQALTEQAEAKGAEMLASLVEKGILTQEQADAQQAWMDSRPDIDIPIMGALAALGPEIRAKGMTLNEDTPSQWLAKLVENGTLTQAEADAYQAWLDERPEDAFFDPRAFGELGEGFGYFAEWEHAPGAKR